MMVFLIYICRTVISNTLFTVNEVLLGCQFHIRSLCEAVSGSLTGYGDGDSAILLVKLDKNVTLTLEEFIEIQKQQSEVALKKLNDLSNKVIQIVWEACAVCNNMNICTIF